MDTENRTWRKACSAHGSCVEVADNPDGSAAMRATAEAHQRVTGQTETILDSLTPDDWQGFLAGIKQGDFD